MGILTEVMNVCKLAEHLNPFAMVGKYKVSALCGITHLKDQFLEAKKRSQQISGACLVMICLVAMISGCCHKPGNTWTEQERGLVLADSSCMRVLNVTERADSLVLRKISADLAPQDISSDIYRTLAVKLVNTVTSPEQDGVGIAGPQVGILRRVVAVMRYDKEGYPFEVYPNIRITEKRGEREPGPEGCLSVPDMQGNVFRYQDITICYTSTATLRDTSETVQGFTAVIFQHECDHLDGILYTDLL